MQIALVHDWLTGMRGGEKCLEPVARRFSHAHLYTLLHRPGRVAESIERLTIHTSPLQRLPAVARYYRWLLPWMPRAIEHFRLPDDLDLVLSFSHCVAKGILPPPGVPHVCYCFTPMRYAHHRRDDYLAPTSTASAQHSPRPADTPRRHRTTPLRALEHRFLDRLRDWDQATQHRVTHFLAVSRTVQQRIATCYGRDSHVIYPPVDTDYFQPASVPREDYYLCLSALVPYKRIDLAIAACGRLRRRLVVLGDGPLRRRLACQAPADTQFLGWRPAEELRFHLQRCRALLFPGHEDFGIVPVEAQACGTPVIALGAGGATETILLPTATRPGTGLFFAEQHVDALCDAIQRFERDPAQYCPHVARQQAEQFNAERYERELFACLEAMRCASRQRPAQSSTTITQSRP